MKPLLPPTLAWIAAVVAAFLLALASPGGFSVFDVDVFSHGATMPR